MKPYIKYETTVYFSPVGPSRSCAYPRPKTVSKGNIVCYTPETTWGLLPEHWFLNCGFWISNINSPWELAKKLIFWGSTSDPLSQKLWGWGPAICVLGNPPDNSGASYLWESLTSRARDAVSFLLLCWGNMHGQTKFVRKE